MHIFCVFKSLIWILVLPFDRAATGGKFGLSARDVATMLRFERDLGADSAATMILRYLKPNNDNQELTCMQSKLHTECRPMH